MKTGLALNDAGAREIKEASFHIIHNRKVVGILENAGVAGTGFEPATSRL